MAPTTPYSKDLGDREPIASIHDAIGRIQSLAARWSPADYERSYAPGKWTARQLLIHLAQAELALGTRARMALTTPGYQAQAFNQDAWIARESSLSGADALAAFAALGRMNAVLFASLSEADRQTTLTHPEYGPLTVDWIIYMIAGHQLHHIPHFEQITRS